MRITRYTQHELLYFFIFYLLIFQNPLMEHVSSVFSYVDELFGLIGVFLFFYVTGRSWRLRARRDTLSITAALAVFSVCGLLANFLYRYQPIGPVLEDFYVNVKFYLSILSGFFLMRYLQPRETLILRHARFCCVLLFSLLLADALLGLFPIQEYRYGIPVRPLFYGHVTYLAGRSVFLLSLLMFYYQKANIPYIVIGLLVLASTLRGKAVAGAAVYILVLFFFLQKHKKIKLWHILLLGVLGLILGWEQFSYYYLDLSGQSARSVMTKTSFRILKDYFPIGTGFGTYASAVAGEFYSPVYVKYGFPDYFELRQGHGFFSDTFWPIIIGQTGFIGLVSYLIAMLKVFLKTTKVRAVSSSAYATVIFLFAYLLISSTSEPAFNNPVSIPLGMVLGHAIHLTEQGNSLPCGGR